MQVQNQEFAGRVTQTLSQTSQTISSGVRPMFTLLGNIATEMKSEVSTLWGNRDEREDLIRTAVISGMVLVGVIILVVITSWMPLWLRLSVLFATIGILAKHLCSKIADASD